MHASTPQLLQTAGWLLVHSFWVGLVLLPLLWLIRAVTQSFSDRIRSVVSVLTLLVATGGPFVAAACILSRGLDQQSEFNGELAKTESVMLAAVNTVTDRIEEFSQNESLGRDEAITFSSAAFTTERPVESATHHWLIASLPFVWLAGMCLTAITLLLGLVGAHRFRSDAVDLPESMQKVVRKAVEGLAGASRITIKLSDRVTSPVLVGIFRPLVLFPCAAVGWSPDVLQFVVLHELAHVQRWDNLFNLLQRCAEAVCFYQPAVWLTSAWVRTEREICCDRFVVNVTRQPTAYAKALIRLTEERTSARTVPDLVTCSAIKHRLVVRVARLLGKEETMRIRFRLVLLVVLMASLMSVAGYRMAFATPSPLVNPGEQDKATSAAIQLEPELEPEPVKEITPIKVDNTRATVNRQVTAKERAIVYLHDQATVVAGQAGVIRRLTVNVGDLVEKGQVIGQIDDSSARTELSILKEKAADKIETRYAEAVLEQAEHSLAQRIVANKLSKSNNDGDGMVKRLDIQRARLQVEKAQRDRTLLLMQMKSQEAVLRQYSITSPLDTGIVTRVHSGQGAAVQRGDAILEVTSVRRLRAVCNLPLASVANIVNGMAVEFVPGSTGDARRLKGVVVLVSPEVDPVNQTVKVEMIVQNPDGKVRAGELGQITIFGKPQPKVVKLPSRMPLRMKVGETVLLKAATTIAAFNGSLDSVVVTTAKVGPGQTLKITKAKAGLAEFTITDEYDTIYKIRIDDPLK